MRRRKMRRILAGRAGCQFRGSPVVSFKLRTLIRRPCPDLADPALTWRCRAPPECPMTTPDGIRWFKENFQAKVDAAVAGTPFDVDFIAAIACQETGHIWQTLRKKKLPAAEVLGLCVGDTLDADSKSARRAFPKRKSDLVKVPGGDRMFDIARQALIDMSKHIPGFKGAAGNPNKFCHGFGMFQLDLQFFKQEPDYFLNKEYADFDKAIGRCVRELKEALVKIGFDKKKKLTDFEMACVGIVYNTGMFNPKKGLKQGHFDGTRFYGEGI